MGPWLPITEYAVKNKVSVSTIRRKIKNQEIKYKLDGGKYLVLDESPETDPNRKLNSMDEIMDFAEKSIKEITKLNQEIINQKEALINTQKNKIQKLEEELAELKMLIRVLEKN